MRQFIITILAVATFTFANPAKNTNIVNVYVDSKALTESDYSKTYNSLEQDTVRLLHIPRMMTVAFYTPDYKGHEFILVNKAYFVDDYDEFYARFQVTCNMHKEKFSDAGTGSMCMVFHDTVPNTAAEFRNFRNISVNHFTEATGCVNRDECLVRAFKE